MTYALPSTSLEKNHMYERAKERRLNEVNMSKGYLFTILILDIFYIYLRQFSNKKLKKGQKVNLKFL